METFEDLDEKLAESVYSHTLVAFNNCFSVISEGKRYNIVNFYYEDIENVEFPVKIKVLEGNIAIIADEKIPNEKYKDKFCSICCPKHLFPTPQRLSYELNVRRGII